MEKIAVYGSGTIGSCEATLIIGHGIPCTVIGHSERGLERCRKAVAQNWDDLIANGLASEDNKAAALELLTVTNDPAALAGCTYVFEAVAEGTAEKQAVYEAIAEYAEPDAVVASCSSSIDAEILAAGEIRQQEAAGHARYLPGWQRKLRRNFNARNFYLTPEGLVFFYPMYAIAPAMEGIPAFTVPWNRQQDETEPQ